MKMTAGDFKGAKPGALGDSRRMCGDSRTAEAEGWVAGHQICQVPPTHVPHQQSVGPIKG